MMHRRQDPRSTTRPQDPSWQEKLAAKSRPAAMGESTAGATGGTKVLCGDTGLFRTVCSDEETKWQLKENVVKSEEFLETEVT